MKNRLYLLMFGCLCAGTLVSAASTVHVKPTDSLGRLRERLANDADAREVVFEEGVYFAGLYVEGPKGIDLSQRPLLIRAAEGAEVVFDGSRPVERFRPHEELPGVFWIDYTSSGGEYPKLWEPHTRTRYRLVADHQTVARFPATYTVEGNRLLFRTSDGQAPGSEDLTIEFPNTQYRGHHKEEGWFAIQLLRAFHCWVRRVTIVDSDIGVAIMAGGHNTVSGVTLKARWRTGADTNRMKANRCWRSVSNSSTAGAASMA